MGGSAGAGSRIRRRRGADEQRRIIGQPARPGNDGRTSRAASGMNRAVVGANDG
jgi:hypothetical protein